MIITGNLTKMAVEYAPPVTYHLPLGDTTVPLNPLLGQKVQLRYLGEIHCIQCGRKTQKSFQQGYCYPCYRLLLECNLCTIHPEKCRYYEGKCNPNHWAHAHCTQPHMVYLANSSGLKVGITRAHQLQKRWIDQGATQGLALFHVQNRFQSGMLEVALKAHIADKTDWRKMLTRENAAQDLYHTRDALLLSAKDSIAAHVEKFGEEIRFASDAQIVTLQYPVLAYPTKLTAHNLEKNPIVEGILQGIKGQYWILDTGVISIRKFAGFKVELHI